MIFLADLLQRLQSRARRLGLPVGKVAFLFAEFYFINDFLDFVCLLHGLSIHQRRILQSLKSTSEYAPCDRVRATAHVSAPCADSKVSPRGDSFLRQPQILLVGLIPHIMTSRFQRGEGGLSASHEGIENHLPAECVQLNQAIR